MNQDLKKALWSAADKLLSSMDAAEYKHLVLGLAGWPAAPAASAPCQPAPVSRATARTHRRTLQQLVVEVVAVGHYHQSWVAHLRVPHQHAA